MLKLYNYLTRKKELFRPLRDKRVGLYTCGPTVYNYAHIGNLRTYIFEDILRRALEYSGYRAQHIMNITDVDDKTIRDSQNAGKTLRAFTDFYAREFFRDLKKLNILPAWKYPRATLHIQEMIRLIDALLKKRLAYKTEDGVYFDISKFRAYGKLSGLKKQKLLAGARVAADEYSKNEAQDFALWKTAKPGEPSWSSPFGKGRPGWHIECSAMSMKYLGKTFDIHAGAVDLLFPHHEDEIAQSVGATGKPFVNYFIEGEHLLVDGKKMSKSLGNIWTLRDLEAKKFDPLDFRYFVLGAHYRTQLNFTWDALRAAQNTRQGIMHMLARIPRGSHGGTMKDENESLKVISASLRQFRDAINDDLNAPRALAALNELLHYAGTLFERNILTRRASTMIQTAALEMDRVFGLNLKKNPRIVVPQNITALVKKRGNFRKEKKWKEADAIREKIKKNGYLIEDTTKGPIIKRRDNAN